MTKSRSTEGRTLRTDGGQSSHDTERLRAIVEKWSCDACGENKSCVWEPSTDRDLCRDCALGETPEPEPDEVTANLGEFA